ACRLAALDNDRLDFRTCSNLRTNRSCCFSNGLGERSETALEEKCGRYWAAADCGLEQQRSARPSGPRAGKGSNNPARGDDSPHELRFKPLTGQIGDSHRTPAQQSERVFVFKTAKLQADHAEVP